MSGYVTSPVVGGRDGYIFNDIFAMNHDGNFVVDEYSKGILDNRHPIEAIRVSHGWVIDGIAVTYRVKGRSEGVTLHHGSQFDNADKVSFQSDEILVGVFGRAGRQRTYGRDLVSKIGFIICDLKTGNIRIAGPFAPPPGAHNVNDGQAFYVSDVLAFGGFAEHTGHLGLAGLFFFKDLSRTIDIGNGRLYGSITNAISVGADVKDEEEDGATVEEVTLVENGDAGDLKDVVKAVEELDVAA